MTFISYAQNFEDVLLWRALKHIKNGFYVDVGAQDPHLNSVTQAFYERGWTGINSEPEKSFFNRLSILRDRDINLDVAAGEEEGNKIFYRIPETGLSTLDKEIADAQRNAGWTVIEQKIRVMTLNSIFDQYVKGPIHFLKIDVEGTEHAVLKGLDLSVWRPWILLIEATLPSSPELGELEWENRVLSENYKKVYFDGLNNFYLAQEKFDLNSAFSVPVNYLDDFITSQHKFALDQFERILQSRSFRVTAPLRDLFNAIRSKIPHIESNVSSSKK